MTIPLTLGSSFKFAGCDIIGMHLFLFISRVLAQFCFFLSFPGQELQSYHFIFCLHQLII